MEPEEGRRGASLLPGPCGLALDPPTGPEHTFTLRPSLGDGSGRGVVRPRFHLDSSLRA